MQSNQTYSHQVQLPSPILSTTTTTTTTSSSSSSSSSTDYQPIIVQSEDAFDFDLNSNSHPSISNYYPNLNPIKPRAKSRFKDFHSNLNPVPELELESRVRKKSNKKLEISFISTQKPSRKPIHQVHPRPSTSPAQMTTSNHLSNHPLYATLEQLKQQQQQSPPPPPPKPFTITHQPISIDQQHHLTTNQSTIDILTSSSKSSDTNSFDHPINTISHHQPLPTPPPTTTTTSTPETKLIQVSSNQRPSETDESEDDQDWEDAPDGHSSDLDGSSTKGSTISRKLKRNFITSPSALYKRTSIHNGLNSPRSSWPRRPNSRNATYQLSNVLSPASIDESEFMDAEDQAEWMDIDGGGAYEDLDKAEEITRAVLQQSAIDPEQALQKAADARHRYSTLSDLHRFNDSNHHHQEVSTGDFRRRYSSQAVLESLPETLTASDSRRGSRPINGARLSSTSEHSTNSGSASRSGDDSESNLDSLSNRVQLFTRHSTQPWSRPYSDENPELDPILETEHSSSHDTISPPTAIRRTSLTPDGSSKLDHPTRWRPRPLFLKPVSPSPITPSASSSTLLEHHPSWSSDGSSHQRLGGRRRASQSNPAVSSRPSSARRGSQPNRDRTSLETHEASVDHHEDHGSRQPSPHPLDPLHHHKIDPALVDMTFGQSLPHPTLSISQHASRLSTLPPRQASLMANVPLEPPQDLDRPDDLTSEATPKLSEAFKENQLDKVGLSVFLLPAADLPDESPKSASRPKFYQSSDSACSLIDLGAGLNPQSPRPISSYVAPDFVQDHQLPPHFSSPFTRARESDMTEMTFQTHRSQSTDRSRTDSQITGRSSPHSSLFDHLTPAVHTLSPLAHSPEHAPPPLLPARSPTFGHSRPARAQVSDENTNLEQAPEPVPLSPVEPFRSPSLSPQAVITPNKQWPSMNEPLSTTTTPPMSPYSSSGPLLPDEHTAAHQLRRAELCRSISPIWTPTLLERSSDSVDSRDRTSSILRKPNNRLSTLARSALCEIKRDGSTDENVQRPSFRTIRGRSRMISGPIRLDQEVESQVLWKMINRATSGGGSGSGGNEKSSRKK